MGPLRVDCNPDFTVLAHVLDDRGKALRLTSKWRSVLFLQLCDSENCWAIWAGGELVMLLGAYRHHGCDQIEIWFASGPALRRNLRDALKLGRVFVNFIGTKRRGLESVVCFVRQDVPSGQKIARLMGFIGTGQLYSPVSGITVEEFHVRTV